jgi:hypothetical protein
MEDKEDVCPKTRSLVSFCAEVYSKNVVCYQTIVIKNIFQIDFWKVRKVVYAWSHGEIISLVYCKHIFFLFVPIYTVTRKNEYHEQLSNFTNTIVCIILVWIARDYFYKQIMRLKSTPLSKWTIVFTAFLSEVTALI